MDAGLLVLRLALGVALTLQGFAKATRDGRGPTRAFLADAGFEPARPLAAITAAAELGAGLLLIAGLATPAAAAAAIGVLINAAVVNASKGWWAAAGGAEYPVTLGLASVAIVFTGAGGVSIDALVGWDGVSPGVALALVALAVGAALPLLVSRRRRLRRRADQAARAELHVAA